MNAADGRAFLGHVDGDGLPPVPFGAPWPTRCAYCQVEGFDPYEVCAARVRLAEAMTFLPALLDGPQALALDLAAALEEHRLVEPDEPGRVRLTATGRVVAESRRDHDAR